MKKYFLIIWLLQTANLFAATPFKKGNTLNVWATQGLQLYQKPQTNSKTLASIPYAAAITITGVALTANPVTLTFKSDGAKPFILKSGWVKIKYKNLEGYVLSGYLSRLPCFKTTNHGFESEEAYLKKMYGEPKVVVKKSIVKKQESILTTTTYANGITQITLQYDSCFDVKLSLINITYQEALLFEQISLFDCDAANNIKIKDLKNDTFEISYNACD